MSCKAIDFADRLSRRCFMSLDRIRASARYYWRRSTTSDRMHSSRRSHDERASSLRSMSDRGKDAAVAIAARSQMLISTTVSFVPVSMRQRSRSTTIPIDVRVREETFVPYALIPCAFLAILNVIAARTLILPEKSRIFDRYCSVVTNTIVFIMCYYH